MAIAAQQKIPSFFGVERTSVCPRIQAQSIPSRETFRKFLEYIEVGDKTSVERLLPEYRYHLNLSLGRKITPFVQAVISGQYEIAELLLDNGSRIPRFDCPVLFFALQNGSSSFIKKLAVQENSIEWKDWRGRTVWHYIAQSQNPSEVYFSMMDVLSEDVIKRVKKTIDVCALGQSPLEIAICEKNREAISLLIVQGANFYPFLEERYSFIWQGIEEVKYQLLSRRFF